MSKRRCTVCQKLFDPDESPALPFCSSRCRMADLNRWLGEGYGLPYERPEDDGEQPMLDEGDE
jgi:uncharacterized protein